MQPTADFNAFQAGPLAAAAQPAGGAGDPDGRQRRPLLLAGQCRQPPRRLADPADFAAGAAHQEYPRRSQGLADAGRARRGRSAGGRADHAGGPGRGGRGRASRELLRRRYLNAHPSAEAFVDFKDFSFFRIAPSGAHLVAGFGRIVDLEPEQFLTDIGDAGALLEAEQGAVEHMNADHREAMNLYATRLLGAEARTGAAPAATPTGSTCRPAARRCGWISRNGSPAGRVAQDAGQAGGRGAGQEPERDRSQRGDLNASGKFPRLIHATRVAACRQRESAS